MDMQEFENLISRALDELPEKFSGLLDNVEIVARIRPSHEELMQAGVKPGYTLLGLYHGIPRTQRMNYTNVVPDRISIFAGPILAKSGNDPEKTMTIIRQTVLHEIGHHFGMNEEQIRKAVNK